MRNVLLIPLAMILAAAAGAGACAALNINAHPREMMVAGAIVFAASALALTPLLLVRGSSQATVSQAGLGGTVLHMFLTLIVTAMAWVAGWFADQAAFLYWLLAFYWVSLIALALAVVRIVRLAPPDPTGARIDNSAPAKTPAPH